MRREARAAAFLWDAVTFARNVGVAVGTTSLEAYLEGGPVAWATERQVELVGEALSTLRGLTPVEVERRCEGVTLLLPRCAVRSLRREAPALQRAHRHLTTERDHSGAASWCRALTHLTE